MHKRVNPRALIMQGEGRIRVRGRKKYQKRSERKILKSFNLVISINLLDMTTVQT